MHSKNGSHSVLSDAAFDAATGEAFKRLKGLNRELAAAKNASARQAVQADMDAVKKQWFTEFGKAVLRSERNTHE